MRAQKKTASFVAEEVKKLTSDEKHLVLVWSESAYKISTDQSLSLVKKTVQIQKLKTAPVILLFLRQLLKAARESLWDNRSLPGRLALVGLAVGLGVAGSEAAGIAALGTAVGIKVYLLTSAGGALLGTIINEIRKKDKADQ